MPEEKNEELYMKPLTPLSSRVRFGPINASNLGTFRVLNAATIPVAYNDKFYTDLIALSDNLTDVLNPPVVVATSSSSTSSSKEPKKKDAAITPTFKKPSKYVKFAFIDGFVVGAICCRLEKNSLDNGKTLYHDVRCPPALSKTRHWYDSICHLSLSSIVVYRSSKY